MIEAALLLLCATPILALLAVSLCVLVVRVYRWSMGENQSVIEQRERETERLFCWPVIFVCGSIVAVPVACGLLKLSFSW